MARGRGIGSDRMRWTGSVFAVLLTMGACRGGQPPAETASEGGPMLLGPENVTEVHRETIQSGPRIAGSLQARRQSMVRAEAGGSVQEVRVELGEAVKAGQLLARIEATALRDALTSAQSGLRSAESDLQVATRQAERIERLVNGGALSEHDLELARNTVTASAARVTDARARLASAQKQIDATVVRAPIDGVVANRAVSEGDVVSPGALLFTLIDPSSMRLEASVPSEHLSALSVGAPVMFEVQGYPGQTFTGQIERIAPGADPVTRQIPILVSIPNPGGKLIAGLFAQGQVASVQREALVVPVDAVDVRGESANVRRIKGGVIEQVPVKTGIRDERTERIEITGAVAAGDKLLAGAARDIASGTQVSLSETQGASAH